MQIGQVVKNRSNTMSRHQLTGHGRIISEVSILFSCLLLSFLVNFHLALTFWIVIRFQLVVNLFVNYFLIGMEH